MARYGIPEDDIALVLGIDAKTLRKHFRLELDVAFVKANAKVAELIVLQAVGARDVHDNSCSHAQSLNCFGRFGNCLYESDH